MSQKYPFILSPESGGLSPSDGRGKKELPYQESAEISRGQPSTCGDKNRMTPPNPWFLITLDEVTMIRQNLQKVKEVMPDTQWEPIKKIATIMDNVEWRKS
jgi:hypothetical protein